MRWESRVFWGRLGNSVLGGYGRCFRTVAGHKVVGEDSSQCSGTGLTWR